MSPVDYSQNTAKETATPNERLQLVGLFALHASLKARLDDIERFAAELTGELGHKVTVAGREHRQDVGDTLAADRLWSRRTDDVEADVDELLDVLGIKVETPPL